MNLSSPTAVSALLKRHDLHPRKRFGQNFLVDGNTLAKIAAAGKLEPGGAALEIGTGLGVLTSALAEDCCRACRSSGLVQPSSGLFTEAKAAPSLLLPPLTVPQP